MPKRTLCALTALAYLSCFVTYSGERSIKIADHKFRTAEDCMRKAPVGRFDRKCDIPLLGWRGAEGMWWFSNVVQGAGI